MKVEVEVLSEDRRRKILGRETPAAYVMRRWDKVWRGWKCLRNDDDDGAKSTVKTRGALEGSFRSAQKREMFLLYKRQHTTCVVIIISRIHRGRFLNTAMIIRPPPSEPQRTCFPQAPRPLQHCRTGPTSRATTAAGVVVPSGPDDDDWPWGGHHACHTAYEPIKYSTVVTTTVP
jgi:hypothetical protein